MSSNEVRPACPTPLGDSVRMLPRSADGKRALLITDRPAGRASRIADFMEAAQINVAAETMDRARSVMGDPDSCRAELRIALAVLLDAVEDVLLIAEARSTRLEPSAAGDQRPTGRQPTPDHPDHHP